jgi:hypothetical protein
MTKYGLGAAVVCCVVLAACATPERYANAGNPAGCRTVYVAGSAIPRRQCGASGSLSEMEKDRLRRAMGGPILTERDRPLGD